MLLLVATLTPQCLVVAIQLLQTRLNQVVYLETPHPLIQELKIIYLVNQEPSPKTRQTKTLKILHRRLLLTCLALRPPLKTTLQIPEDLSLVNKLKLLKLLFLEEPPSQLLQVVQVLHYLEIILHLPD